jgi:CheY-like chemotaxis protein
VIALLTAKAEQRGIKLRCQIDPAVAERLLGDPGRIRQVLTNLLDNAIKFTEHGFVLLQVAPEPGPAELQPISFTIRDSGIGISPEKLATIFEKFTQADASTTRKYGGTGLGLTICRQLAEVMGGSIAATSTPGEGSTFTVLVPFRRSEAPPVKPAAAPAEGPAARLHGKILLAEDYPANQKIAKWMLERLGCSVTIAVDGREALARLAEEPFDLVLMDCQMPEMDGYEATRAIRAGGAAYAGIPVIAMTAAALETDRQRCLAVGMNDYLSKPVQQETLAAVLARWLPAAGVPA